MRSTADKRTLSACITGILFLITIAAFGRIQSYTGTWLLNPASGVWTQSANWNPFGYPYQSGDVAQFGQSNQTSLTLGGQNVGVSQIIFNPGASAYTIAVEHNFGLLELDVGSIINNSSTAQNFTVNGGGQHYLGIGSAGTNTFFTTKGAAVGENPGIILFYTDGTADHGTFIQQ